MNQFYVTLWRVGLPVFNHWKAWFESCRTGDGRGTGSYPELMYIIFVTALYSRQVWKILYYSTDVCGIHPAFLCLHQTIRKLARNVYWKTGLVLGVHLQILPPLHITFLVVVGPCWLPIQSYIGILQGTVGVARETIIRTSQRRTKELACHASKTKDSHADHKAAARRGVCEVGGPFH